MKGSSIRLPTLWIMLLLSGLCIVASCSSKPTAESSAFGLLGVSPQGIPAYRVTNEIKDRATKTLMFEVISEGMGETDAKQVIGEVIEIRRGGNDGIFREDYHGISARITRDWSNRKYIGIYAKDEAVARALLDHYGVTFDPAMVESGYPLIIFLALDYREAKAATGGRPYQTGPT